MTAEQFKAWRAAMGLSQQQAAEALGLSRLSIINYEAGRRREDGRPVAIPKTVELACAALAAGLDPWTDERAGDAEAECSATMRSIAEHLRTLADMEPDNAKAEERRKIAGQVDHLARTPFGPGAIDEFEELQEAWRDAGAAVWDDLVGSVIRLQFAEEARKRKL